MMNFDFSAFLLFSTVGTGVIAGIDKWYWRPQRLALLAEKSPSQADKEPIIIEYARSFFPVLLVVFLLRSFVVEPYRIPSGSMKPSLLVGDFILVNKYTYGIKLPVFNQLLFSMNTPQRGDVMVFKYPVDPGQNFIKRVIGLPGDTIAYKNKQLYINGKLVAKDFIETKSFIDEYGKPRTVKQWVENLQSVQHPIYERGIPGREIGSITVPRGHYFMMGDNRDDSDDSRIWGFVPKENIVGKAFAVWMSWDSQNWQVRFNSIPRWIK